MADGAGEGLSERKVDVIEVVLVLLVAWSASWCPDQNTWEPGVYGWTDIGPA